MRGGEIRCTGDSEGGIQRGPGMNEEKVLHSVLGTSGSRVGTEGAERGHVFCRVTDPGANQTLRKLSLWNQSEAGNLFMLRRSWARRLFSECLLLHFSSGVLQIEVSVVFRPNSTSSSLSPLRASCCNTAVRRGDS